MRRSTISISIIHHRKHVFHTRPRTLMLGCDQKVKEIGRYLNHVQKPNMKLTQTYYVRGMCRIAVGDVEASDEVVCDYGVRGEVWSGCRLMNGVVRGSNQETNQDEEVNLYKTKSWCQAPLFHQM